MAFGDHFVSVLIAEGVFFVNVTYVGKVGSPILPTC